jgi:VWFA-related protein
MLRLSEGIAMSLFYRWPQTKSIRPIGKFCHVGAGIFALLLLAQNAPAQDNMQTLQAGSQPAATISITAREVLLDVVVTDSDGRPVTGLTPADFKVTEEGDAQRVDHLEEHRAMGVDDVAKLKAAQQLPPNTFTNFTPLVNTNASTVILLDVLDTHIQAQMELREQLIDYLKHMEAGTPIAIFELDTDMHLIQGFSSDPQVLLDAAKGKRDMPTLSKLVRGSPDEYRRARMSILHAGFQMMGRYLAGFPGRKNLVWFTGGIPQSYLSDPLGTDVGKSFKDDFALLGDNPGDLVDALTLSRVAVYPIDARGLETLPQFQASSRHGGSGAGFEASRGMQHIDMDSIADETGGKAYYNTNGLKQVLGAIVNNGSNYYTLAYATTNQKWNGQMRHIKVKVGRPGVHLQYRQGYYAVDRAKQEERLLAAMQKRRAAGRDALADDDAQPDDAQQAAASDGSGALIKHPKGGFAATMTLGAIPPTEVVFKASLAIDNKVQKVEKNTPLPDGNYLAADYKSKPFRTYTVHIQADAHSLRLSRSADGMHHGTIEFVTVVYDQTGAKVNSLITTAVLNVNDAHYAKMLQGGLGASQQIAVPVKGNYFMRVGVHDVASDHIGALEIPVDEVRTGVAGQGLAMQ